MAKKLFDYVHEILSQQETLVVPDFGAFVLQKTTTFLNDADYISIIFTAQQQHDDGVLKKYIADKNNLTEDEVEEFISSALEEVYLEINNSGIFKVEGIGEFRAVNDSIVFKPYDEQFLKGAESAEDAKTLRLRSGTESEESKALSLEEAAAAFLRNAEDAETLRLRSGTESAEKAEIAERVEVAEKVEVEKSAEVAEKPEQPEQKKNSFDIKKYTTGIVIFVIVALLSCTLYCFRNEIANLNKPTVTNDTTQVASPENMQQLSDTLAEINNAGSAEEQSITDAPTNDTYNSTSSSPTVEVSSSNNSATAGVILKGNVSNTTYYVTKVATNSKQDAVIEMKNLDVTGFQAKIIETTTGKKYHVVIAEYADEASAKEELNFSKKIDNQFYLTIVKPNDK